MEPKLTSARRLLRGRHLLAALVLPALAVVGCSSDDVAERITEAGLGEGSDVSIDSESGDMSVKTKDGEITSSSSGNTKLPDAWPAEIPMPEDYKLTSAMSVGTAPELTFNLSGDVSDAVETFDAVTTAFIEQGWTEEQRNSSDYDGGVTSSATYAKGDLGVAFSAIYVPEGNVNTFSYTVVPRSS